MGAAPSKNSTRSRPWRWRRRLWYIRGKQIAWAQKRGISTQYIEPGKPQQTAYVERYKQTIQHKLLDQHIIECIEAAHDYAAQWLWTYNNECPNMGIGAIAPAQKVKLIN